MKISDVDRAKLEDLFSFKEIKAIDDLSNRLELDEVQIINQALRLYQIVQKGLDQKYFSDQELMNFIEPRKPNKLYE